MTPSLKLILLKQLLLSLYIVMNVIPVSAQKKNVIDLEKLLRTNASSELTSILNDPQQYQYQILYTEINRDRNNKPFFKYYHFNTDREKYFYPASTVKLPTVLATLEKLNTLNITGLDKYAVMLTDSAYSGQSSVLKDSSSENQLPSIGHYIKKIFLVSDNDAYNRLYEFNGQKYLNEIMWEKGYTDVRIVKRFIPLNEDQNRHTNPIRFYKDNKLIYEQKPQFSEIEFDFRQEAKVGKGYMKGKELVNEPLDFTRHNRFPLEDQQQMLQALLFPGSTPKRDFNLKKEDYDFLYKYMSQLPSASTYPKYDDKEYFDSYAKFFMYRDGKRSIPANLKIFNKAGWSYGFLTDNCYIADLENKVEFMLTAVIYANKDDILNDDKYDYEEVGYPFFREVGEIIYKHELQRKRKHKPDFSFGK
ncbi:serine hydrolase [Desertivirga arenae]|uniref:serine hydrolase n=1 Tax=Desertivirga arenae TaxID=2810309 RepID=UPI001F62225F|nr:serine hydrolase [Pedobacter sp. SYSU D00823]